MGALYECAKKSLQICTSGRAERAAIILSKIQNAKLNRYFILQVNFYSNFYSSDSIIIVTIVSNIVIYQYMHMYSNMVIYQYMLVYVCIYAYGIYTYIYIYICLYEYVCCYSSNFVIVLLLYIHMLHIIK